MYETSDGRVIIDKWSEILPLELSANINKIGTIEFRENLTKAITDSSKYEHKNTNWWYEVIDENKQSIIEAYEAVVAEKGLMGMVLKVRGFKKVSKRMLNTLGGDNKYEPESNY